MPPAAAAGAAAARGGGAAFKAAVRAGHVLTGLFLNSASPLVAEQLATLPYDYMLASEGGVHTECTQPPCPPWLQPAGAAPPAVVCMAWHRTALPDRTHPMGSSTHKRGAHPGGHPAPAHAAQVDIQHAPTDYGLLGACITAVNAAGKPALVRVEGPHDRGGIQQVGAPPWQLPLLSPAA